MRYRQKGLGDWTDNRNGRSLVLDEQEQWRILDVVTRQGYLDGINHSRETVDNLKWEEHKKTHLMMREYSDFQIQKKHAFTVYRTVHGNIIQELETETEGANKVKYYQLGF